VSHACTSGRRLSRSPRSQPDRGAGAVPAFYRGVFALAVLDLTLPAQSSGVEKLKGDLQLEVVIRPDGLNVGDRIGGQIPVDRQQGVRLRLPGARATDAGAEGALSRKDRRVDPGRARHSYDVLVGVMDAVRETRVAQGANVAHADCSPTFRSATHDPRCGGRIMNLTPLEKRAERRPAMCRWSTEPGVADRHLHDPDLLLLSNSATWRSFRATRP